MLNYSKQKLKPKLNHQDRSYIWSLTIKTEVKTKAHQAKSTNLLQELTMPMLAEPLSNHEKQKLLTTEPVSNAAENQSNNHSKHKSGRTKSDLEMFESWTRKFNSKLQEPICLKYNKNFSKIPKTRNSLQQIKISYTFLKALFYTPGSSISTIAYRKKKSHIDTSVGNYS